MSQEPINTLLLEKFIQQVKSADSGNQREIRIDIATAKNLALTLGIVMSRLNGDLEKILLKNNKSQSSTPASDEVIKISINSGSNWS